jgi:hypothetical protein
MLDLLKELGAYRPQKHRGAHLDPDLVSGASQRRPGWLPCFGQAGAAQTHLANQGVGVGDLILFFGSFRKTVKTQAGLKFDRDSPVRHLLFGYLEIGKIIRPARDATPSWMDDHPHVVNQDRTNNTIYVARRRASWNDRLPGAATFRFREELILSDPSATTRNWRLPRCFHPSNAGRCLSRHGPENYRETDYGITLRTVSPGQEYVIAASPQISSWARNMIQIGPSRP